MNPKFQVIDLETDEDRGIYETLGEARGCVEFDRLTRYSIWSGRVDADGDFSGEVRVEFCDGDFDDENIYGLASVRQSIEEDRR